MLIAVILIIAGYFAYTNLFKEEAIKPPVFIDPKEKVKSVQEPQFKKEGELEFLSANSKDTIRKIDVELATNDDERMQGLMYRKSMDDNKGMLFIFDKEEEQSFWMKNTIMSLDIIYINSEFKIVKIYKGTTPFSENSLPSGKPTKYVVEVAAGFTDRYKIKEGDKIMFTKN
ncbi:MAG: DUF192 domain-containing protein [Bacteroidetes bacterium]|nr:DUF192 domain-containing protein [Bacteroidota bacterium]